MGQAMKSTYIGVTGGDVIPVSAALSIFAITRQPGDSIPQFGIGTKGYTTRQIHFNLFMESQHDAMLLLDHDMIFAPDTLERLRGHGRPFVSGYYLRRNHNPIAPVWNEPFSGQWPLVPWLTDPERGVLHRVGSSGWGCIYIEREVVVKTRAILRGEPDVIEDDMDVWPYDLAAVLRGEEQLRPLRGDKSIIIGSDIRYPFYALAAGYQLYGDPDVRPAHILDYPLSPDDFGGVSVSQVDALRRATMAHLADERAMLAEVLA